jgi:hypothetical protein
MYVEGAPVLRNSSNVVGLAASSAAQPPARAGLAEQLRQRLDALPAPGFLL